MKLELWEAKVSVGKFDFFENLSSALGDTTDQSIFALVKAHLSALRNELQDYFPDLGPYSLNYLNLYLYLNYVKTTYMVKTMVKLSIFLYTLQKTKSVFTKQTK